MSIINTTTGLPTLPGYRDQVPIIQRDHFRDQIPKILSSIEWGEAPSWAERWGADLIKFDTSVAGDGRVEIDVTDPCEMAEMLAPCVLGPSTDCANAPINRLLQQFRTEARSVLQKLDEFVGIGKNDLLFVELMTSDSIVVNVQHGSSVTDPHDLSCILAVLHSLQVVILEETFTAITLGEKGEVSLEVPDMVMAMPSYLGVIKAAKSAVETALEAEVVRLASIGEVDYSASKSLGRLICCLGILDDYMDMNADMCSGMDDIMLTAIMQNQIGMTNTWNLSDRHSGYYTDRDQLDVDDYTKDMAHICEFGGALQRWEETVGSLGDRTKELDAVNVEPDDGLPYVYKNETFGDERYIYSTPSVDLAILLISKGLNGMELDFTRPIEVRVVPEEERVAHLEKLYSGENAIRWFNQDFLRGLKRDYGKYRINSESKLKRLKNLGRPNSRYRLPRYWDLVNANKVYRNGFTEWMAIMKLAHDQVPWTYKLGTPNRVMARSDISEMIHIRAEEAYNMTDW